MTLFGHQNMIHGGYGALTFGYSEIENLNAATIGGQRSMDNRTLVCYGLRRHRIY